MVIFYTLPPSSVFYPYILINASNPEPGLRYVARWLKDLRSCSYPAMILIDSGVEIFRKSSVREYPGGAEEWIKRLVWLYRRVKSLVGDRVVVHATCPDYPDDYSPRSLWISREKTNVERTVENVIRCTEYRDVSWLIPIQGWYRNPAGLLRCLDYYDELGIAYRYNYFAIANLCTELDADLIYRSVYAVWRWFAQRRGEVPRLHVFGLRIAALKKVSRYLYSFDTTAWTRPVNKRLHDRYPWSAKNLEQKTLFFCEYAVHLASRYGVDVPLETLDRCSEVLGNLA